MNYFISTSGQLSYGLSIKYLLKMIRTHLPSATINLTDRESLYLYHIIYQSEQSYVEIYIPHELDSVILDINMIDKLSSFVHAIRLGFNMEDEILLYVYVISIPWQGIDLSQGLI
jgi:hypothetical protein